MLNLYFAFGHHRERPHGHGEPDSGGDSDHRRCGDPRRVKASLTPSHSTSRYSAPRCRCMCESIAWIVLCERGVTGRRCMRASWIAVVCEPLPLKSLAVAHTPLHSTHGGNMRCTRGRKNERSAARGGTTGLHTPGTAVAEMFSLNTPRLAARLTRAAALTQLQPPAAGGGPPRARPAPAPACGTGRPRWPAVPRGCRPRPRGRRRSRQSRPRA